MNSTGVESICIHHNDEQVSSPTVKTINLIKACGLRFMAQLYQCLVTQMCWWDQHIVGLDLYMSCVDSENNTDISFQ